jgi:hypothetical protein
MTRRRRKRALCDLSDKNRASSPWESLPSSTRGGRFVLGLGSQVWPRVEHRFSMPWSKRASRMTIGRARNGVPNGLGGFPNLRARNTL